MAADTDTLARGSGSQVDSLWPLLQRGLSSAQRLRSDRMRTWSQQMMIRAALFWLSFAIAWAGMRAVSELTLRRWMR